MAGTDNTIRKLIGALPVGTVLLRNGQFITPDKGAGYARTLTPTGYKIATVSAPRGPDGTPNPRINKIGSITVLVYGNNPNWTAVSLPVGTRQVLNVQATGTIKWGAGPTDYSQPPGRPDVGYPGEPGDGYYVTHEVPAYGLVVKIGQPTAPSGGGGMPTTPGNLTVEQAAKTRLSRGGYVWLIFNDNIYPDNVGYFTVTITVAR